MQNSVLRAILSSDLFPLALIGGFWPVLARWNLLSQYLLNISYILDLPSGSEGKASAYNVADLGSIPGLGRSPGEGNGNPLQYSCLENPLEKGAGFVSTCPYWRLLANFGKVKFTQPIFIKHFLYFMNWGCGGEWLSPCSPGAYILLRSIISYWEV